MAAPTPSWNLVRVYGTWRGMDGALRAGTYKVTLPARITNTTDDAIIPAGTYASGALQTAVDGSPSLDVLVPATDDPDNAETGWKVSILVSFTDAAAELYVIDVPVANRPVVDGGNGAGVNLRTVVLSASIPQQVALYKVGVPGGLAQLDASGQVIDANGDPVTGTGGGAVDSVNGQVGVVVLTAADVSAKPSNYAPTWDEVTGKPAVIAAGTSQTAARDAIGAGTSSLQLGTGPTTAKAGNWVPAWTEVTGKPTTFAPSAHTHPAADVSDSTLTGRALLTAADAAAARTAIGAGTSSLQLGTTSSTAKAGDYQPTAANISDATTVGRNVLKAVDAAAARTAIGAGTSSLTLGTAAGTALAGDTAFVPPTRTVAGKALSANVTLVKADVGLGNVDNTSDAAKPVSTATQAALDDLGAQIPVVPSNLALMLWWTGTAWPADPTGGVGTLHIIWVGGTDAAPPPAVNGRDIWVKSVA